MTDALCLYVITLRDGKPQKKKSLLVLQDLWSSRTPQKTEAASCSEILLRIILHKWTISRISESCDNKCSFC